MTKINYSGYRFPLEIIQQAISSEDYPDEFARRQAACSAFNLFGFPRPVWTRNGLLRHGLFHASPYCSRPRSRGDPRSLADRSNDAFERLLRVPPLVDVLCTRV